MEMLMKMYLDGMFDKMLPNNPLPKRNLTGDETRVQLDKKLKGDFSFRVWQSTDLINDPSFGVRALELLMKMYVDGKIKIKKDE